MMELILIIVLVLILLGGGISLRNRLHGRVVDGLLILVILIVLVERLLR